jgi:4-amino-4-deoxy-L-arabinose transferase-like glycosyltransferase
VSQLISHSPLYPLFLTIFLSHGETPAAGIAILVTQHLLGLLSVIFFYLSAREVFRPIVAFCSGMLLSLHSLLLCYECVIQAEILLFFLLSIAIFLAQRAITTRSASTYVLTAVFCALAALTRPAAQLYIGCVLLIMYLALRDLRKFSRAALLMGVTYAAVISPWLYANHRVHGFIGLSHGEGLNLISRVFDVDHMKPVKVSRFPKLRALYRKIAAKRHQICCRFRRTLVHDWRYSALEADKAMFSISFETLVANPIPYLRDSLVLFYDYFMHAKNSVKKCSPAVGGTGCVRERRIPATFLLQPRHLKWTQPILKRAFDFPSFICPWFVSCSLLGVAVYFRRMMALGRQDTDYVKGLLLVVTALYFAGVTAAFRTPHDRYRFPADPVLIMFAVSFLSDVLRSLLTLDIHSLRDQVSVLFSGSGRRAAESTEPLN